MPTLFLADFTVFFVVSTTSLSFYFPFPDLHIYSFTLPDCQSHSLLPYASPSNSIVFFSKWAAGTWLQNEAMEPVRWQEGVQGKGTMNMLDQVKPNFIPWESVDLTLFIPKYKCHCMSFFFLLFPTILIFAELTSVKNSPRQGIWSQQQEHVLRFVKAKFPCFLQYLQAFLSQGHSHSIKCPWLLSCHSCMQQLKFFLPWYSNGEFKAIFQHAILPVRSVMVTKNILVFGSQFKSSIWIL